MFKFNKTECLLSEPVDGKKILSDLSAFAVDTMICEEFDRAMKLAGRSQRSRRRAGPVVGEPVGTP